MSTTDYLEIAGLILTVVGIIATREWLIQQIKKIIFFFQRQLRNLWFRSLLLLAILLVVTFLLYSWNVVDSKSIKGPLILIFTWFLGGLLLNLSLERKMLNAQEELNELKIKIEVLNRANQIKLENVKEKWQDFVDSLMEKPGYQVVGAFLKLSEPVYIENDTLLLSIPEVVFNASSNFSLEGVTPLLKAFYGVEYKLKLSVIGT